MEVMASLDGELRHVSTRLRALIQHTRGALITGVLNPSHRDQLRELTARFDQLVVLRGGAPGAPQLMTEAVRLLEKCDPLAYLRRIKLDYIDHLVSTCDSLMRGGEMPDLYLKALGEAVGEFESAHGADDEEDFLAFAWDVLAQAEAGIGEATYDLHYEQAQQRYRRARRGTAPVLALVSAV